MRNTLAFLVIAGLGAWTTNAAACGNLATVWGQGAPAGGAVVGTVQASQPNQVPSVRRYHGLCGAQAVGSGSYLQDGSPGSEQRYLFRFYVFTGTTGGTAKVFQAVAPTTAAEVIGVTYDGAAGSFVFNTSGANGSIGSIVANRWYEVKGDWNRTANTFAYSVQGNNSTTAATGQIAGIGGSDSIDVSRLGFVSGTATGNITVDLFESRRATAIPRQLRGDSNNNGTRTVTDATIIVNEVLNGVLAPGNADCNEQGTVTVADATCVSNLILNGGT